MKMFLIVCSTLVSMSILCQRLEIDNDLLPYVENLVEEANTRNFKNFQRDLVRNINFIQYGKRFFPIR